MITPRLVSSTTQGLALGIALAGCGRFGFANMPGPPDDGEPPEMITLVVTSDEYGSDKIGTPISGATVLVEHADGVASDRLVTDGTGTAQFPAAGVTASHVVFKGELGWRLYTVAIAHAGTIELGSRPEAGGLHRMSFTLPSNASTSYTVRVPQRCASPAQFSSPSVTLDYAAECEGQAVRVIAFSRTSAANPRDVYLDAGRVTLTNGTARQLAGSYQEVTPHTLKLTNLPAGTDSVTVQIGTRSGVDLTPLSASSDGATSVVSDATVVASAAPGGDTLGVLASPALPVQYSSSTAWILPATIAVQQTIDATAMLPLFTSLAVNQPPAIGWTSAGSGGTLLAVAANAGTVQWDAYLEPSATSLSFPALPADLGVPVPKAFDYASVRRYSVPGATTPGLARTFDRIGTFWPHDSALLPPEGGAMSGILYSAALGPPVTAASADVGAPRRVLPDPAPAAVAGSRARARPDAIDSE